MLLWIIDKITRYKISKSVEDLKNTNLDLKSKQFEKSLNILN